MENQDQQGANQPAANQPAANQPANPLATVANQPKQESRAKAGESSNSRQPVVPVKQPQELRISEATSAPEIPRGVNLNKFDGQDFPVWKTQVQAYFLAKGEEYFETLITNKPRRIVRGGEEVIKERDDQIANYEKLDRLMRPMILLALDNKHARMVLNCQTSKEIFDRLIAVHEQNSAASKIVLQKEFFDLQMGKEEPVEDYIARAEYLWGRLLAAGVKAIDEATLVNRIVASLPRRFINFMSSWSSVEPARHTLGELIPRLMAEDQLQSKFRKPKSDSNALATEWRHNNNRNKNNKHKSGNQSGSNNANHANKNSKKTFKYKCYGCQEKGHMKRDCPKINKNNDNKQAKSNNSDANNVSSSDAKNKSSEIVVHDAIVVEEANLCGASEDNWIIDSGVKVLL